MKKEKQKTEPTKGVVLIACGSPFYGQWALNLAMSIKYTDKDAKITLCHYGSGANHVHYYHYLFDKIIKIDEVYAMRKGIENLLRPKVCLYDLSPYDETVFIDADVICFPTKKITDLFEQLKNEDFAIGCRSEITPAHEIPGKEHWTPSLKLLEKYATSPEQKIYHLSSEFIYFKKTAKNKQFFEDAKKAFDDPGVDYIRFANGVPDELAFQIAMLKNDIKPHDVPFLPFYWEPHEKKQWRYRDCLNSQFYGYSMGGITQHEIPMEVYNFMAKFYAQEFGMRGHFPMRNKRLVIENRTNI